MFQVFYNNSRLNKKYYDIRRNSCKIINNK